MYVLSILDFMMKSILLLLIATCGVLSVNASPLSTTTPMIYQDSLLGGSCRLNTNCQGLVLNSRCRMGKCACRVGYVAIGRDRCVRAGIINIPTTTTATIYYDSLLGGYCYSTDNCIGLVSGAICVNHTCVCQPGKIANGKYSCISVRGMYYLSLCSSGIIFYIKFDSFF